MVWFMIRFEGRGLKEKRPKRTWLQRLLGQEPQQIKGFFTTRSVDADHAAAAEEIAKSLLLNELAQHNVFDLSRLQVFVDDIWTVRQAEANPEAKGFTFYVRDE